MDEEMSKFINSALDDAKDLWNGFMLFSLFLFLLSRFLGLEFEPKLNWMVFIDAHNPDQLINLWAFFVAKAIERI